MMKTVRTVTLVAILGAASCSTSSSSEGSGGAGGSSTGGTTGSGGATGSGGKTSSGGTVGNGGAAETGGVIGKGGAPGKGGASSGQGGMTIDGGLTAKGGATGDGGPGKDVAVGNDVANGGAPGTGGATGPCEAPSGPPSDKVITFNDNGGWCWYQDERAIVDAKAGKLVIGSVGFGGTRDGNIEAVIYDIASGKASQPAKLGNINVDDHSAPALNIRPDGKYIAVWAGHRVDCNTYYSIYDGSAWGGQKKFDWSTKGCPWDGDNSHMITYSNVWYASTGQLFDIARSVSTSPAILSSDDDGSTWSLFGRLSSTPRTGYVAGYYKYWGNNTDRIDFLATEAHPRDNDNNLWHGYVKGGKVYNSAGTVVDDNVGDTNAKDITGYTQVFKTGSTVGSVKLDHAWNHDIVRYEDGTIAFLGQGRVVGSNADDPDKRMIYGRFDGTAWKLTYIAKLGPKLYSSEQDYTGLGSLHPDDPHTIFISTMYDPRDDTTKSSKHEIWQGTTCDNGATFKWTPVTKGSSVDNLRPIVPKWDAGHTALLWMQGTYRSAQDMTMKIVGMIAGQ
jgi:hypothetical protein